MTDQRCGTCKYFDPIDKTDGRMGYCDWQPSEELATLLPIAFTCDPPMADDATDCPTYTPTEEGRNEEEAVMILTREKVEELMIVIRDVGHKTTASLMLDHDIALRERLASAEKQNTYEQLRAKADGVLPNWGHGSRAENILQLESQLSAAQQRVKELWKQSIELDGYEVANLESALKAAIEVDGCHPLSVFNNGGWIGQIIWKLEEWRQRNPDIAQHSPNRTPDQFKTEAIQRLKDQLEQQLIQAQARLTVLREALDALVKAWSLQKPTEWIQGMKDALKQAHAALAEENGTLPRGD